MKFCFKNCKFLQILISAKNRDAYFKQIYNKNANKIKIEANKNRKLI